MPFHTCPKLFLPLALIAFGVACLLATNATTQAATIIPIANYSFEDDDVAEANDTNGGATSGVITDWDNVPTSGAFLNGVIDPGNVHLAGAGGNTIPLPGTADGFQAAYGNNAQNTTITQDLVTTVADNTDYTLTVAIGDPSNFAATAVYDIRLLANGIELPILTSTLTTPVKGTFVDAVKVYRTEDVINTDTLTVQLVYPNLGGPVVQLYFDNVRLTFEPTVVPEPASLAMMVLSAGLMCSRTKRNR